MRRHHRYIFEEKKPGKAAKEDVAKVGARLQELGPRFTLKLRSLQVERLPKTKPYLKPLRAQTAGHCLHGCIHCIVGHCVCKYTPEASWL